MKTIKPYIRIYSYNSHVVLQVDTWALKDYLEDYLTEEYGIEYEYYKESINSNGESYNLFYSNKYTQDQIENEIKKLNDEEIEKIVKSNP